MARAKNYMQRPIVAVTSEGKRMGADYAIVSYHTPWPRQPEFVDVYRWREQTLDDRIGMDDPANLDR